MSWDNLVYSTVSGGLFFYRRQSRNNGIGSKQQYYLTQEVSFENEPTLYDYQLSVNKNMLTLAVNNEVHVYTQDNSSSTRRWKRESIILESDGDYGGYIGAAVGVSDGHLMVATKREVNSHDFTGCALSESAAPTHKPTRTPTVSPTITPGSPTCLFVNLVFDNYPSDTSWKIEDHVDGFVLSQSPGYDSSLTDISSRVCLPGGNYAFTIADEYGDGMCCSWGEGSYNITTSKGDVIALGGSYGFEERTVFTMPYDPATPFVDGASPPIAPTPKPVVVTPVPTRKPTQKPTTAVTPAPTPKPIVVVTPAPTAPPTPKPTQQTVPVPVETPALEDCFMLDVTLNLDQYPVDTTWEIIPQGSKVAFYNSIPYKMSQAFTPDTQSVCLPEGMYDFKIYDVYEDGM